MSVVPFYVVLCLCLPTVAAGQITEPDLLLLVWAGPEKVGLTWRDRSYGESGFRIKRSDPRCVDAIVVYSPFLTIAETPANTQGYLDNTVPAPVLCGLGPWSSKYRVWVLDANGSEVGYDSQSLIRAPVAPPLAPSQLEARYTKSGVILVWNDNSIGEFGFHIERRDITMVLGSAWRWVGAARENTTVFGDTGAETGRVYEYRVSAFHDTGVSDESNVAEVVGVAGDINDDKVVNVIDLGIMLSHWGDSSKPPADLNRDGTVDILDLGILLSNWGARSD